ncbi:ATP-binding cassette domain-containing protein, partial [Rhizobium ruizarguesonis]
GRVDFSGAHFADPSRPRKSPLHGLTDALTPGETVANVGPSGAGKSTVKSLLMRYYDPQQGSVKIDGDDAQLTTPDDLRQ